MRLIYLDQYHFYNESIMPPAPVVVKVGVDGVDDLRKLRVLYPTADIVAYEADPKNFKKWAKDAESLRVRLVNKAVGEAGVVTLHRFVNTVGNSVYPRHTYDRNCRLVDSVEVESLAMPSVVEDVGGRIDLLVLNCEGGELPIMHAMVDESIRGSIGQICVSFHDPRIYKTAHKREVVRSVGGYYHIVVGDCPRGGIPDQLWIRKL